MATKAFMTKAQVGNLPAFGSPVGQAHHRALHVNDFDFAAYSATSNALCWREARHDWKRSKAKIAGKPQPSCKNSAATARGSNVVWPRQRGNLAA